MFLGCFQCSPVSTVQPTCTLLAPTHCQAAVRCLMLISIVKLEKENKYLGNLILYFCWGGNCLLKSLSMFIHVDCSVLSSFTLYQLVCTYNYNTYGEGKWVFLPLTALIGRGKHYCCLSWQCNVDIDIVITKTSQQDVCSAAGREITT